MNENKCARILNRIFHICFFVCMAATFIGTLIYGYTEKTVNYTGANGKLQSRRILYSTKAHLLIYLAAFLMLVFFCLLYYFSKKDFRCLQASPKLSSEAKFRIIMFSMLGVMLLIQLYVGAELKIYPRTDLKQVVYNAESFATTGSFDTAKSYIATGKDIYMARYPNNFMIMLIIALLYRVSYLLTGTMPLYLPVILNVIAINISLLFTVLIAKRLWGRRKAVYVLCLLFIFAPYYVYVPFYYTDTLSMPFGMLGLYLFMLGLEADKSHKVKKYLMLAIAGAVLFLGFKVKGSIAVIFAVALVYSLLKYKLRDFACIALALVIGFGSFAVMFNVGYNAIGLVTEEQADRYEYPMTHWVMMGLKGKGGWNQSDSDYTSSFETKAEKQEANIKVIKSRVKALTERHQLVRHFAVKAVWMWGDGTYFIPGHITDYVNRSYLHDFVLRDGRYYYIYFGYSNAYQLVLLLMMVMSLLKGVIKPKIDLMLVIKGSVFALFLFLLIWEGRSRYLFNMTPLFILMMTDGISYTTELVKKAFNGIKNKRNNQKLTAEA